MPAGQVTALAAKNTGDSTNYIGSRDIHQMQVAVGYYLEEVYYYYDVFAGLLEEELGRTGTTTVTSHAEEALLKLTTLIKSIIFSLETTIRSLGQWKKAARGLEIQGICN